MPEGQYTATSRGFLSAIGIWVLFAGVVVEAKSRAELRPLRKPIPLDFEGAAGVARDTDGNFYISSSLSRRIARFSPELRFVDFVEPAVDDPGNPILDNFPAIIRNPTNDTLFLLHSTFEILEMERDGTLTDFRVTLEKIPNPPKNAAGVSVPPAFMSIAFDPAGNGGAGSFWVLETITTAIFEISLSGDVIRSFCHPDDPDGCPGDGTGAPSRGLGILGPGDNLTLELVGGDRFFRDQIRQVRPDGTTTGLSFPLCSIGGRPGGFLRDTFPSPETGDPVDVFFVTVETGVDELHVLEIVAPDILDIEDFEVSTDDTTVDVSWRNTDSYDAVEVFRDGVLIASLPGAPDTQTFSDDNPPTGILKYEVVASKNGVQCRREGSVVFGPGRVLNHVSIEDASILGMTEDGEGNLWVTFLSNEIGVFSKDLITRFLFDGPFQENGDQTTGIAFDPRSEADSPEFFVYNLKTNEVVRIDGSGAALEPSFPSGVPPTRGRDPVVLSMLFDPDVGTGGSFWYLDWTSSTIQQRDQDGNLLSSCAHPDRTAQPPAPHPESTSLPVVGGMSSPQGGGFDRLTVSGGTIRDSRTTRILQVDTETCLPTGAVIPTDDLLDLSALFFPVTIHNTLHDGRPVLYVAEARSNKTVLFELSARAPQIPLVTDLECFARDSGRSVELSFVPGADLDRIEIRRNDEVIATIPPTEKGFLDTDAPAGPHSYSVRGILDGEPGDDRECSTFVQAGATLKRGLLDPLVLVHQVAFDQNEDLYVVASRSRSDSDSLHFFDAELEFQFSVNSPFQPPMKIAAMAIRSKGPESEYFLLGMDPSSAPVEGDTPFLPIRVIDSEGRKLDDLAFNAPIPLSNAGLVSSPSGMAWDGATDTFWLYEQNTDTIVNFDLRGTELTRFPHPSPVHQDLVASYGIAVAGDRNALYLPSAGLCDHHVTKLIEVTANGLPTGVEIPVTGGFYDKILGFTLDETGRNFVISAVRRTEDLVMIAAFDDVEPVSGLTCTPSESHATFDLHWTNGERYDRISVHRGGNGDLELLAELTEDALSFTDRSPPTSCAAFFYRIVGHRDNGKGLRSSAPAYCVATSGTTFVRGNVTGTKLDIADPVAILRFLFLGIGKITCQDTADVDDDGRLLINDPVHALEFLFRGGPPPAAPFPQAGCDPTEDPLDC